MSLRKAINEMCRSCIYDKFSPGTWRDQTKACTVTKCALYAVRPIPVREKAGTIDPGRSAAMKARWSDPSYRERIKTAKQGTVA